jgi:hypothetical protein
VGTPENKRRRLKKLICLAMSRNREVFNAIVTNNTAFEFSKQIDHVCGEVFEEAMKSPAQIRENNSKAMSGYYQNMREYKMIRWEKPSCEK